MKMAGIPFTVVDWNAVPPTNHPGESGSASWRTVEGGGVRTRIVDYSPGYRADHWCSKGHVVFVLAGEIDTEIQGGPTHKLLAGMSYRVADDIAPHRSSTTTGARLFIVD